MLKKKKRNQSGVSNHNYAEAVTEIWDRLKMSLNYQVVNINLI